MLTVAALVGVSCMKRTRVANGAWLCVSEIVFCKCGIVFFVPPIWQFKTCAEMRALIASE